LDQELEVHGSSPILYIVIAGLDPAIHRSKKLFFGRGWMRGSSPRRTTGDAGLSFVMPGLVPGIHVLLVDCEKDVDGRVKPGHDGCRK
jgi:hypothetical protein